MSDHKNDQGRRHLSPPSQQSGVSRGTPKCKAKSWIAPHIPKLERILSAHIGRIIQCLGHLCVPLQMQGTPGYTGGTCDVRRRCSHKQHVPLIQNESHLRTAILRKGENRHQSGKQTFKQDKTFGGKSTTYTPDALIIMLIF